MWHTPLCQCDGLTPGGTAWTLVSTVFLPDMCWISMRICAVLALLRFCTWSCCCCCCGGWPWLCLAPRLWRRFAWSALPGRRRMLRRQVGQVCWRWNQLRRQVAWKIWPHGRRFMVPGATVAGGSDCGIISSRHIMQTASLEAAISAALTSWNTLFISRIARLDITRFYTRKAQTQKVHRHGIATKSFDKDLLELSSSRNVGSNRSVEL